MKAFVSVDLEGMPYIAVPGHLNLKGSLYEEARRIATKVTLTVAEELHKNGFDEVVIADSHGPMVNLLVDDLPEYVEIVRGYPRPLSMAAGIEGCDAAVFLGYHAKFGTARSTFDHTYSGAHINRLVLNDVVVSEFLLNGYVAGESDVPVIMVAGEAQLIEDDVKRFAPWSESVVLKRSLSRVASQSQSMLKIQKQLQRAAKKATLKFKTGKAKVLKTKKPVKVCVTFATSGYADVAELAMNIKRVDGLSVEFSAGSVRETYRMFELLVFAASGLSSLLANMT